jgi:hypothetical protein
VVFSFYTLLFGHSEKDPIAGIAFLLLVLLFWLLNSWVKNTKYVGFIIAIAFYSVLWTYTDILHFLVVAPIKWFLNSIKDWF